MIISQNIRYGNRDIFFALEAATRRITTGYWKQNHVGDAVSRTCTCRCFIRINFHLCFADLVVMWPNTRGASQCTNTAWVADKIQIQVLKQSRLALKLECHNKWRWGNSNRADVSINTTGNWKVMLHVMLIFRALQHWIILFTILILSMCISFARHIIQNPKYKMYTKIE